jgi:sugar fermentation stimulation protein A
MLVEQQGMTDAILYTFDAPLALAEVMARPSKIVRSPYVADIRFPDDETIYQAHAPSLGCSGLVDVGSNVYVKAKDGGTAAKTTHTIHGTVVAGGFRVGVNPMLANQMVRTIIASGYAEEWLTLGGGIDTIKNEVCVGDSRVDLCIHHKDGSITWVEVKNVPLAHMENSPAGCADYRAAAAIIGPGKKIALFPDGRIKKSDPGLHNGGDGYRKSKDASVSPRALKHLDNLAAQVAAGHRAYCVFLCQRTDADRFEPAALDIAYCTAYCSAVAAGVQIRCYVAAWEKGFKHALYGGELAAPPASPSISSSS